MEPSCKPPKIPQHLDDNVGIGQQPSPTRRYNDSTLGGSLIQRGQMVTLCREACFQVGDSGNQIIRFVSRLFQSSQVVQPSLTVLLLPKVFELPQCWVSLIADPFTPSVKS